MYVKQLGYGIVCNTCNWALPTGLKECQVAGGEQMDCLIFKVVHVQSLRKPYGPLVGFKIVSIQIIKFIQDYG